MMQEHKLSQSKLWWGLLLIAAGVFFLLQNMGIFVSISAFVALLAFALGGAIFLVLFLTHPQERWWAAIPGGTLLGLGTTVFIDTYAPAFLAPFAGSAFLGSIGIGFLFVYLANRSRWWALIPGGVLSTLAVVAGVDSMGARDIETGGIFFIGLGLTFLLVAMLPHGEEKRLLWAWIPAGVLMGMGLVIGTGFEDYLNQLWPVILIGIGIFWVVRNAVRPR